jgi:surface polysaccharide O-acyltransferase-like enzyme
MKRIAYLDAIRTVAVSMVVAIHTMGYVPIGGSQYAVIFFLVHTVAVPVFFLVDGIIFAKTSHEHSSLRYRHYLLTSTRRLLIPWVLFNLLYLVLRASLEYFGFFSQMIVMGSSWVEILRAVYSSQISEQMYFLLSLFFIRCLALVWYRVALFSGWIVLLLWACYVFLASTFAEQIIGFFPPHLDPFLHAILGLKFYLLGFVLFKWHDMFERSALWAVCITLSLTILLKFYTSLTPLVQLSYLLFLYFSFLGFFKEESTLSSWGRFTMGIYLLHVPIILKGLSILVSHTNLNGLNAFIIVFIAGFFVSLFSAKLLNKMPIGRFALGASFK